MFTFGPRVTEGSNNGINQITTNPISREKSLLGGIKLKSPINKDCFQHSENSRQEIQQNADDFYFQYQTEQQEETKKEKEEEDEKFRSDMNDIIEEWADGVDPNTNEIWSPANLFYDDTENIEEESNDVEDITEESIDENEDFLSDDDLIDILCPYDDVEETPIIIDKETDTPESKQEDTSSIECNPWDSPQSYNETPIDDVDVNIEPLQTDPDYSDQSYTDQTQTDLYDYNHDLWNTDPVDTDIFDMHDGMFDSY